MQVGDIIQSLDNSAPFVTVSINQQPVLSGLQKESRQTGQIFANFLDDLDLSLEDVHIQQKKLTGEKHFQSISVTLGDKTKSGQGTNTINKSNEELQDHLLDSVWNLLFHEKNAKSKLSGNPMKGLLASLEKDSQSKFKLRKELKSFMKEMTQNLKDSLEFFYQDKEGLDLDTFKRILDEISENLGLEFMRLNTFSEGSREENLSQWKNKNESACNTYSNSFWNQSDNSHIMNSVKKDFQVLRSNIENSLKQFKMGIQDFTHQEELEKFSNWKLQLQAEVILNEERIVDHFKEFSLKLEVQDTSGELNKTNNRRFFENNETIEEEMRPSNRAGYYFIDLMNISQARENWRNPQIKSNRRIEKSPQVPTDDLNPSNCIFPRSEDFLNLELKVESSIDSGNKVSTKKKSNHNVKSSKQDTSLHLLNQEIDEHSEKVDSVQLLKQKFETLNQCELEMTTEQTKILSGKKEMTNKLGFGFFLIKSDSVNDTVSAYDSSMTHRLLDALLDDRIIMNSYSSRKKVERGYSKTTDPKKMGLKEMIQKINQELENQPSLADNFLEDDDKHFKENQIVSKISLTPPELEVLGNRSEDLIDTFIDHNDKGKDQSFKANSPKGLMSSLTEKLSMKLNLTKEPEISENLEKTGPNEKNLVNASSLTESFQLRKQHLRWGSYVSKRSNSSQPEDWKSRLGEKIDLSRYESGPEVSNSVGIEDPDKSISKTSQAIPFFSKYSKIGDMKITEEKSHEFNDFGSHFKEQTMLESELVKSPELSKSIQKRFKNLILRPGKSEKEILMSKLVRASKETRSISKSLLSHNSSVEAASGTIANILSLALAKVLKKFRKRINELLPQSEVEELEEEIKEMPRGDLERKMIQIMKQMRETNIGPDQIQLDVEMIIKKALKIMKKEVELPFENLVNQNIKGLEELWDLMDMIKMENIQLEYGMLKLTQMYNQIVDTLQENDIQLEMPYNPDANADSLQDKDQQTKMVETFCLKDFREQIRQKVEMEKLELDKNLLNIQETPNQNEQENEFDPNQEQVHNQLNEFKSLEINLNEDLTANKLRMGSENLIDLEAYSKHKLSTSREIEIKDVGKEDSARKDKEELLSHKGSLELSCNFPMRERSATPNPNNFEKKKRLKKNGSFLIDFNKEKPASSNRGMIKTMSGAIKTVVEMKEEYYNTKKFNVELLVENQELAQLNNQLNGQVLNLTKDKSNLEIKVRDIFEDGQDQHSQSHQHKITFLEKDIETLLQQNKKLLEDSKGTTEFLLNNYSKVKTDLQDTRDELDLVKREMLVEVQMMQRIFAQELVPRVNSANRNVAVVCAVNEDYEKEKKLILEKVNQIYDISAKFENEEMKGKGLNKNYFSENGYSLIGEFCNEVFEIHENRNSLDLDGEQMQTQETLETPKQSPLSGVDYNKVIYSEFDFQEHKKNKQNRKEMENLHKISAERDYVPEVSQLSQQEGSNPASEHLGQYQINYDQSYMGVSSSGDSEEFNNGMDLLLKEYMTDQMKKSTQEEMQGNPLYNTEKQDPVDVDAYLLNTDDSQAKVERNKDLGRNQPINTQAEIESSVTFNDTSNEDIKVVNAKKEFKFSINTMGNIKEENYLADTHLNDQESDPTLEDNQNDFHFQNLENSNNNNFDGNRKTDLYLDRESGFEDLVEKFIGVICLENLNLRQLVINKYNEMFRFQGEDVSQITEEDVLRSLKDSIDFKNRMVECLSENDKKNIANEALKILSSSNNLSLLQTSKKSLKVSTHLKKHSRGESSIGDLMKKLERLKNENNFFVIELDQIKKATKMSNQELNQLKKSSEELQNQNEILREENIVLEQRLEYLEPDDRTEAATEYDDAMSGYDMYSQRLSNNMKIIQEEDEEDDMDSMISGKDTKTFPLLGILGGAVKIRIEQGSVDNESHYSFGKDFNKSEFDEAEAESEEKETNNWAKIKGTFQRKIRRRATTENSQAARENLNKQIDEYNSPLHRRRSKKSRRTVGHVGFNINRKKILKSESYRVNKRHSYNQSCKSPEQEDPDNQLYQMNKNFKSNVSKSSDPEKINFKKLISNPTSKSFSISSNPENNHSKFYSEEGLEEDKLIQIRKIKTSNPTSARGSNSPIVSLLSQDKSYNQKFNFSKNFEDGNLSNGSSVLKKSDSLAITNQNDTNDPNRQNFPTKKHPLSQWRNMTEVLKDLEIFHAMSFSSSISNDKITKKISLETENSRYNSAKKFEELDNSEQIVEKEDPKNDKLTLKGLVESITLVDVNLNEDNSQVLDLKKKINLIKEQFSGMKFSEQVNSKVNTLEAKILSLDSKIKKVSEIFRDSNITNNDDKSFEKDKEMQKRPRFTSQFSSCKSIDKPLIPETPTENLDDKDGTTKRLRNTLGFSLSKCLEDSEPVHEKKESTGRILFKATNTKGRMSEKRASRMLLREFINKNLKDNSREPHNQSPFEKKERNSFHVEAKHNPTGPHKSIKEFNKLEMENLKLKNALEMSNAKHNRLETDFNEAKKGLEKLLESMPLRVKQSPVLKMGDKHFREILEIVRFQVEEYKEAISLMKQTQKETNKKEFNLSDHSSLENTEELINTSVLNTKKKSLRDSQEEEEEEEDIISDEWEWDKQNQDDKAKSVHGEISIRDMNKMSQILKSSEQQVSEMQSEKKVGLAEDGKSLNSDNNILDLQISERHFSKFGEEKSFEENVGQEEGEGEGTMTLDQMKRKKMRVQGCNMVSHNSSGDNSKSSLYKSSGVKRGNLLLDRLSKKSKEIHRILISLQEETNGEVDDIIDILTRENQNLVREVEDFLEKQISNQFEGQNNYLYNRNHQTESEELQSKLGGLMQDYQLLEQEMERLRTENDHFRRVAEQIEDSADVQANYEHNNNEQIFNENPTSGELSQQEGPPDQQLHFNEERQNSGSAELDLQPNDDYDLQKSSQGRTPEELESDINEMIFDLLEVIEDTKSSTVEKTNVIRYFLYHTHDLLGSHNQDQMREYTQEFADQHKILIDEEDQNQEMESSDTNKEDSNSYHKGHQQVPHQQEENVHEIELSKESSQEEEETDLECWEERLEMVSSTVPFRDVIGEVRMSEERPLTEIKEDDSEEYRSNDKVLIDQNLSSNQNHENSSQSPPRGVKSNLREEYLHEMNSEANVKDEEELLRVMKGGMFLSQGVRDVLSQSMEDSLKDHINELEDEKVQLKNQNIMLIDEISLLKQKIGLFENKLEDKNQMMEKVKGEKKEIYSWYENKSKKMKDTLLEVEAMKTQQHYMNTQIANLKENIEDKNELIKELNDKIDNLQEINNHLATENELRSHEMVDYSLMRSSDKTQTTPCKDSQTSLSKSQNHHSSNQDKSSYVGKIRSLKKSITQPNQSLAPKDRRINKSEHLFFNIEQMGPAQDLVATDRSEFPKGFGVQQLHLEEIIDQQKEIKMLKSEKYNLVSRMTMIKEDAKLNSYKYEEHVKDLKTKLKKYKEQDRKDSHGYRGGVWLKKKVTSCKIENELRKKNLRISKLTGQIKVLQGQVKSLSVKEMLALKYTASKRFSSNTESKNSLYQRDLQSERNFD